jgi:hypothetical protein
LAFSYQKEKNIDNKNKKETGEAKGSGKWGRKKGKYNE